MTEKRIVKKHGDHLQKKESPIKDKIYPEVQLEKRNFRRNETTVNSPVTANNPSQNISDPSPQKQLRTQINKDDLIEPKPDKTKPGSRGGCGDLNIFFETISTRKKTAEIFRRLGDIIRRI